MFALLCCLPTENIRWPTANYVPINELCFR